MAVGLRDIGRSALSLKFLVQFVADLDLSYQRVRTE